MKKITLPCLALLLGPAAAFASTVEIDWSGQISDSSLSDTSVSGVIDINTDLLPTPDAGNPPGVTSFSGAGYLQSSVLWTGGTFLPEPAGSSGSNSLYIDTNIVQCNISDSSTYTDSFGTGHTALLSLNLSGLDQLATSLGLGTFGGVPFTGGGFFADFTDEGGFGEQFTVDSAVVKSQVMPAPEIDPSSAFTGLTLLAGALAVYRGRRG